MSKTEDEREHDSETLKRLNDNPLLIEFKDGTKTVTSLEGLINDPRFYEGSYRNIKSINILEDKASKILYDKNNRSSSK